MAGETFGLSLAVPSLENSSSEEALGDTTAVLIVHSPRAGRKKRGEARAGANGVPTLPPAGRRPPLTGATPPCPPIQARNAPASRAATPLPRCMPHQHRGPTPPAPTPATSCWAVAAAAGRWTASEPRRRRPRRVPLPTTCAAAWRRWRRSWHGCRRSASGRAARCEESCSPWPAASKRSRWGAARQP